MTIVILIFNNDDTTSVPSLHDNPYTTINNVHINEDLVQLLKNNQTRGPALARNC